MLELWLLDLMNIHAEINQMNALRNKWSRPGKKLSTKAVSDETILTYTLCKLAPGHAFQDYFGGLDVRHDRNGGIVL